LLPGWLLEERLGRGKLTLVERMTLWHEDSAEEVERQSCRQTINSEKAGIGKHDHRKRGGDFSLKMGGKKPL